MMYKWEEEEELLINRRWYHRACLIRTEKNSRYINTNI